MARLVHERQTAIAVAEAAIKWSNERFDEQAIPLGRRIAKLRPQESVEHSTKSAKKPVKPPNFTGLTDQEIEHYRQLAERNGN
jgi:hypothetical protein